MTVRALLGLATGNAVVLVTGSCLLWGVRGLRSWAELVRLSGAAYMIGVVALGVALSIELVLGVPFRLATVMLTCLALTVAGLMLGRALGREHPFARAGKSEGIGLVAAAYGALVVVYFEALFRAGRLAALSNYDGWAFWVPKAKVIYLFGGLDEGFFRELPNPTYPPLVPALEAAAFHAMGSADVVTLHVQFAFFLIGFVAAVAGLLAPRVHAALLWPVLLLVLVAPRIVARSLEPQADFLLDYLFALAALLVALWLVERRTWQLCLASLFLAGAMLTKREGQLLAGMHRDRRARGLVAHASRRVAADRPCGRLRTRPGRALATLVRLPRPHRRVSDQRVPRPLRAHGSPVARGPSRSCPSSSTSSCGSSCCHLPPSRSSSPSQAGRACCPHTRLWSTALPSPASCGFSGPSQSSGFRSCKTKA